MHQAAFSRNPMMKRPTGFGGNPPNFDGCGHPALGLVSP
jgi:hypothetical protein